MYRNAITRIIQNVQKSSPFLSRTMSYEADEPNNKRIEKCINNITLMGRVGADIIIQQSARSNATYGFFPLATNSKYDEGTQWHRIVVFDTFLLNNYASKLKKGDRVYLTGKLLYRYNKETNTKSANIMAGEVINFTKKYQDMPAEEPIEMDEEVVDGAKV